MAFGLFKKKAVADIIYMNGHIYTQDPAFPWASAVACKDGKILAVGDYDGMEEIISSDTQVVDLAEQYMFPGFIDVHGTPVLKAFEELYLSIDPIWDLDRVLEAVGEYAQDCDEEEIIFGYGFHEQLLADYPEPEDAHRLLDEIEEDRPVVLLGISGVHCWLNSTANDIVVQAAEESGVEYVSTDYILNLLSPFDFEAIEKRVVETSTDLADKGFTAVLNLCAPDYFSNIYQDCLLNMMGDALPVRQRFFGSLYINRPLIPDLILHKLSAGQTNCIELGGMITFDMLKAEVSDDEELAYFPENTLETICLAACEKGFDLHLDALDPASQEKACQLFNLIRSKGCKNNTLVLASDREPEEEDGFLSTWPTDYLNASVFGHVHSVTEAVDALTIDAAALAGKSRTLGSIEQGKLADFTVFEENPFDVDLRRFSHMQASMTVLGGEVCYNLDEECEKEIYDLMTSMQV